MRIGVMKDYAWLFIATAVAVLAIQLSSATARAEDHEETPRVNLDNLVKGDPCKVGEVPFATGPLAGKILFPTMINNGQVVNLVVNDNKAILICKGEDLLNETGIGQNESGLKCIVTVNGTEYETTNTHATVSASGVSTFVCIVDFPGV